MKITKEQLKQMIKEELDATLREGEDTPWEKLLKDMREFAEGYASLVSHEPMGHHMVAEKIIEKFGDEMLKTVSEDRMEDVAYNIGWKAAKGYDEY